MADNNIGGAQDPRAKEIEAKRQEKIRAARQKKLVRRLILAAAALVILGIIAGLVAALVKGIKKLSDSSSANAYYCTAFTLENVGNSEVVNIGSDFFVISNGNLICAKNTGNMLWSENLGEGDFRTAAQETGIVIYSVGGDTVWCFNEAGLVWKRSFGEPVAFVTANGASQDAVVCTDLADGNSRLVMFKTKNMQTAEETVLEKKYSSNHVVSAAISPSGKSIAVVELSESGTVASTRVSVIDVSTGRSFFSKVIEGEVCPYCAFVGEDRLACAGRKNIYIVEKLNKNSAQSAKFNTLISLGDTGNGVLCILSASERLVAATGNGEGKSEVRIFSFTGENEKIFSVPKNVKGLLPADEEVFACYTQNDFMIYDFDGNKVGACDEKLDAENASGNGKGYFAVSGAYGTLLIELKNAAKH